MREKKYNKQTHERNKKASKSREYPMRTKLPDLGRQQKNADLPSPAKNKSLPNLVRNICFFFPMLIKQCPARDLESLTRLPGAWGAAQISR